MPLDPKKLAVEYYFGDLQYWKMPRVAQDALAEGYDGPALRSLAGSANRVASDIRVEEIDSAFREMGVDAPIAKEEARLVLAIESARRVLDGKSDAFEEATHVRIHLCELSDPPDALSRIVNLSKEAKNAPRSRWASIKTGLNEAFKEFLLSRKIQGPE